MGIIYPLLFLIVFNCSNIIFINYENSWKILSWTVNRMHISLIHIILVQLSNLSYAFSFSSSSFSSSIFFNLSSLKYSRIEGIINFEFVFFQTWTVSGWAPMRATTRVPRSSLVEREREKKCITVSFFFLITLIDIFLL